MEFDYENWLLNALYGCAGELGIECKIEISSERSFAMPKDTSTLLFIVKRLSGSVLFDAIKVQPVQIICYTEMATMDKGMQILDLFTKLHNNEQFTENNILIKQTYDTVVSLRPFVATENSFRASLYTYGSLVTMDGIADIQDLRWYNPDSTEWESVNPISITDSYSCVPNTQKVSSSNLSETKPQEATLVFTMTVVQNNKPFISLVNSIAHGLIKQRKIKFRFYLKTISPEYPVEFECVLTSHNIVSSTTEAPALSLTFQV